MQNKHLQFIFLVLCTSVLFSSCIVVNYTSRDFDNTCEVHHIKMKRAVVGTYNSPPNWSNDTSFVNAKKNMNVGCEKKPWPIERLAIIYHCAACDSTMAYNDKLN